MFGKKAELLSQPFIYIFMVVVIGLIVVFGFTQIDKLLGFGCAVEGSSLLKDFEEDVQHMSTLASGKLQYSSPVPDGLRGICFVDPENLDIQAILYRDVADRVKQLAQEGVLEENIFFSGEDPDCTPEPYNVKNLKVKGGTLCFHVAEGKFNYVLEKRESYVEISELA